MHPGGPLPKYASSDVAARVSALERRIEQFMDRLDAAGRDHAERAAILEEYFSLRAPAGSPG